MMKLNEKEVNAEIALREVSDLNRSSLQDLANLYVVRDHFFRPVDDYGESYSRAAAPRVTESLDLYGDSDFLRAVSGKDPFEAWSVMDELMDTLKLVQQKAYDSVMRKLREL